MNDITEVGDLRDQRNLLIARGIDPNLDQTPCGLCGQLYCDVCPENTASEPEMNDITQLSTLYSNAIARAEKAEEALRVERERCARIADAHALDFEKQAERHADGSMHDSLLRVADGCELVADAIRTPPPVRETP